jgi:hypothetical protein
MSYFMISGVDMWGGDNGWTQVSGLDQAKEVAKAFIGGDHRKVASILHLGGNNYGIWFKTLIKTNPSHHDSKHLQGWTVSMSSYFFFLLWILFLLFLQRIWCKMA